MTAHVFLLSLAQLVMGLTLVGGAACLVKEARDYHRAGMKRVRGD